MVKSVDAEFRPRVSPSALGQLDFSWPQGAAMGADDAILTARPRTWYSRGRRDSDPEHSDKRFGFGALTCHMPHCPHCPSAPRSTVKSTVPSCPRYRSRREEEHRAEHRDKCPRNRLVNEATHLPWLFLTPSSFAPLVPLHPRRTQHTRTLHSISTRTIEARGIASASGMHCPACIQHA